MRKLIVSIHSTLNNVVTGPPSQDETDFVQWAQPGVDDSTATFVTYLNGVDTFVMGRGTYQDLVRKWPTVRQWPGVSDAALAIGEKVNTARKFVVTSTLPPQSLTWGEYEPATHIPGDAVVPTIMELKAADGGNIMTFGSPVLVRSLLSAGLIDEFQITVHPVIVSEGRRLFEGLDGRTDLRLVNIDRFDGGAMTLVYSTAVQRARTDVRGDEGARGR